MCIITHYATSVVPKLRPRTHTKLGTDVVNLWAEMRYTLGWNDCFQHLILGISGLVNRNLLTRLFS